MKTTLIFDTAFHLIPFTNIYVALAFLSFKRAIAMFAGVPLLGVLPPEYAEWLAEARRWGRA